MERWNTFSIVVLLRELILWRDLFLGSIFFGLQVKNVLWKSCELFVETTEATGTVFSCYGRFL